MIVNLSTEESFGIVFLEAWLAGTPVIAADIGVTHAVVTHDGAGLLVPPGDSVAVSGALLRLLSDPAARRRLVAAGRRKADAHTWDATAEAWRTAYSCAIQRSARRTEAGAH